MLFRSRLALAALAVLILGAAALSRAVESPVMPKRLLSPCVTSRIRTMMLVSGVAKPLMIASPILPSSQALPISEQPKEFARHKEVSAALGASVYFAHPHSPWERGTNENTNGLIREYLPKGLDFREVRNDDVLRIVERLNNRPRKCLGFRTPREAFFNLTVAFRLTI